MTSEAGVLFPAGPDGRRSTAATGRAVWGDAVRGVDDEVAARVGAAKDWRKDYVDVVVGHTAAATRTAEGAVRVARQGLASLAERMVFERDGRTSTVAAALAEGAPCASTSIKGEGDRRTELALPYRGEVLTGDALRRQVDTWVARGTIEPSCGVALHAVVDDPQQLDVSDSAFALMGAGAEMGPLE